MATTRHPDDLLFNDYLASGDSDKDYMVAGVLSTMTDVSQLPATLDLSTVLLPPRAQGKQSSCVAFACAAMREYHAARLQAVRYHLSPQFLYDLRPDDDAGFMVPRRAFDILRKVGVSPDADVPQREDDAKRVPSEFSMSRASAFRIDSYWRVTTVDECRVMLYEQGPCVMSLPVFEKAYGAGQIKFYRPLAGAGTAGDKLIGFHMMAVVGYTKDAFVIRNSWGPAWNGTGHFELPFDEWESVVECWCVMPVRPSPPDPTRAAAGPAVTSRDLIPETTSRTPRQASSVVPLVSSPSGTSGTVSMPNAYVAFTHPLLQELARVQNLWR